MFTQNNSSTQETKIGESFGFTTAVATIGRTVANNEKRTGIESSKIFHAKKHNAMWKIMAAHLCDSK